MSMTPEEVQWIERRLQRIESKVNELIGEHNQEVQRKQEMKGLFLKDIEVIVDDYTP